MTPPRALARPLVAAGLALLLAPNFAPGQSPNPKSPIDWDELAAAKPTAPATFRDDRVPADAPPPPPASPFQRLLDGIKAASPPGGKGSRLDPFLTKLGWETAAPHAAPTPGERLFWGVQAAINRKEWASAIAQINQIDDLDDESAARLRDNLYAAKGLPQNRIGALDDLVRLRPDMAIYRLQRGLVRCKEQDRGGLDDIEAGARLCDGPYPPDSAWPVAAFRAEGMAALGDHAAALPDYEEAAQLIPSDETIRLGLVRSLVAARRFDNALAALDGPAADGSTALRDQWRAYALIHAGRFAEGLEVASRLPSGPKDVTPAFDRAVCLAAVGRTAEARVQADAILKQRPGDPTTRCLRASILLAEGNSAGAYDEFAELASAPDARLLIFGQFHSRGLLIADLDRETADFAARSRVLPKMPWAVVARVGEAARSSREPGAEFCGGLLFRLRAAPTAAPVGGVFVKCYHDVQPWRPYAQAGQVAAALALGDRAKLLDALENIRDWVCGPYSLADEIRAEFGR